MTAWWNKVTGDKGEVHHRLRTRLVLALSALVASAMLLTGWATLTRVERTFSRTFRQRVQNLLQGVEVRLETLGRGTSQRMESLASGVMDDALVEPLLVRPDPSHSLVIESASRMSRLSGLDLLQILDAQGTILSSAQWPERVGFEDDVALELPAGQARFRWERTRSGDLLAQVVRSTATLGDRMVHLVGGKILNEEFLRQASPAQGEAILLLDANTRPLVGVGGIAAVETWANQISRSLEDGLRSGEPARGRFRTPDGSEWAAGSMPLRGPGGELQGTLLVAADRAELEVLVGRLRNTFLVIGALGVMLAVAVGFWVAQRITRPVTELVKGVELISSGREHEPFPAGGDDEIGRLMTAFSRMDRSLRVQQKRLLAAERVAAWKEVAQRVAHEVKNPLSPIRLTVENLIKARRQAPDMFDELFDEGSRAILEEVNQLGNIVTEFSEFARLPAPTPEWVDLDGLVDSVLSLYSKEASLAVRRVQEASPTEVFVDAEQISRALKNLLKNAVEAMEPRGGGELHVTTGQEGETVHVEVCDSGPGFPQDTAGRIFEPYFTTKEKGTGLGMAIALRIISEHGGSLSADNRPGGGARVTVTLPISGAGAREPEALRQAQGKLAQGEQDQGELPGGDETITQDEGADGAPAVEETE